MASRRVKRELEDSDTARCWVKGKREWVKAETQDAGGAKRRLAAKSASSSAAGARTPLRPSTKLRAKFRAKAAPKAQAKTAPGPVLRIKKEQLRDSKVFPLAPVLRKPAAQQQPPAAVLRKPAARLKQFSKAEVKTEQVDGLAEEAERRGSSGAAVGARCARSAEACKRSGGKRRRLASAKREPTERPPFEALLPFFVAQCKAFQLAKRVWSPTRPCCMANCFMTHKMAPTGDLSCYERMSGAKQGYFRRMMEGPEAKARKKCQMLSRRLFNMLWYPDREPDITVRRSRIVDDDPRREALYKAPVDAAIGGQVPGLSKALAVAKARKDTLLAKSSKILSGVPGVRWDPKIEAWTATWKGKGNIKVFPVQRFRQKGRTEEEANQEALHNAIVFRERLVLDGVIKVAKTSDTNSKGIFWNKKRRGWDVYVWAHGKKLRGGFFRPIDESKWSVEKAHQAAVECRQHLEMRFGRHGSSIMRDVLQQSHPGATTEADDGHNEPDSVPAAHEDLEPDSESLADRRALPDPGGATEDPEILQGGDQEGEEEEALEPEEGEEDMEEEAADEEEEGPEDVEGEEEGAEGAEPDDATPRETVVPPQSRGLRSGRVLRSASRRRGGSQVGVTWRRWGCHWRVQMWVNGKLDRRLFKPEEDRPEELERELLAACKQEVA